MASEIFEKVESVLAEVEALAPKNMDELEQFRIKFLGSKNRIKPLFGKIKEVANERKKEYGQLVNSVKEAAEQKYLSLKTNLEIAADAEGVNNFDLTAPGEPFELRARHPVSIVMNRIVKIFERIGFVVEEEREIEDDWHNFTAMNTPEDHPARDMQDTFYLKDSTQMLLRTHTSSVQARVMTNQNRRFASSPREGYIATKQFQPGLIVNFTRWKGYI